ncbi:MAG: serine hydrolase [Bacteroidetes bacterium]|nr:serine hydrolase [Bacteroidota bacterium]
MFRLTTLCLALVAWASCHRAQVVLDVEATPSSPSFLAADSAWVDSVLATLPMEQRVAQLLMVPIYAYPDTSGWSEAERWARDLKLGGVICMQGGPEQQRNRLARLQAVSEVPLMVASDAEWGLGMRLDSTRSFPRAMTLGATRNEALVRMFGQVVGQSLRATGVHVNFAPVLDVNSNPINPVIGSRSFGEDVQWVGRLGQAYADGMQDVHVLATAKHFPGHGDSDSDSHATLPTIAHDRARLDSVELAPFQFAFDRGMGAVMVAHLDVPGLDSTDAQPSTLSPAIVDSLLRDEMGFEGLVFTDAMSMKGFADFVGDRPRIRDALLAGNDVLLFPGDPRAAIEEAMAALAEGTLDSAAVTAKCRRVLQAKHWTLAPTPSGPWEPEHADLIHRELIAQSLTVLPMADSVGRPWLEPTGHVVMLDLANHTASCAALESQLRKHLGEGWTLERHVLGKDGIGMARQSVRDALSRATRVLVTATEMSHKPSRNFGLVDQGVKAVAEGLNASTVPASSVQAVWMGNPYALASFAPFESCASWLMVAYQDDSKTCEAVADAITGVRGVGGALPVTPPGGRHRCGDGLTWEGHQRLGHPVESRLGFWERPSQRVDSLIQVALDSQALPGGRVVVAHGGQVVMDKVFGTIDGHQPVHPETVYDLASITKVAATASMLMHLQSEEKFHLDAKVADLLPHLSDVPIGTRTARELLAHQAGLKPWIPFYTAALEDSNFVFSSVPTAGCDILVSPGLYMEEAYQDTIWHHLIHEELRPAGDYKYSDLGFYILRRMLDDKGLDLATWIQEHLALPMGWESMTFNPMERGMDIADIAPTEVDGTFRHCTVHGTVHDPGAAMLGGVGCHAGLFSNAYDLAEMGEAWLRGGSMRGVEVAPKEVLNAWTARAYPQGNNRRGVAFDKPALHEGTGPTSDLASWESFGHSGFTGTLLWVDPAHDLVYVFLSNRTYPKADNFKLLQLDTRTEIQTVILEHLGATSRFVKT